MLSVEHLDEKSIDFITIDEIEAVREEPLMLPLSDEALERNDRVCAEFGDQARPLYLDDMRIYGEEGIKQFRWAHGPSRIMVATQAILQHPGRYLKRTDFTHVTGTTSLSFDDVNMFLRPPEFFEGLQIIPSRITIFGLAANVVLAESRSPERLEKTALHRLKLIEQQELYKEEKANKPATTEKELPVEEPERKTRLGRFVDLDDLNLFTGHVVSRVHAENPNSTLTPGVILMDDYDAVSEGYKLVRTDLEAKLFNELLRSYKNGYVELSELLLDLPADSGRVLLDYVARLERLETVVVLRNADSTRVIMRPTYFERRLGVSNTAS